MACPICQLASLACAWRRAVRAAALAALLLAALACASRGGSGLAGAPGAWRGFRGFDREGRGGGAEAPLSWSPTRNVVWRTPIRGEGHSSPVVTRDAVYVTTAWQTPVNRPLLLASRLAQLALLALLVCLGVAFTVRRCALPRYRPGQLLALAAFGAALGALCLVVLFAEPALDFGSAVERPWLAGCLAGTFALVVASAYPADRSRAALVGGLALLVLSGVLAATVPDRQHTIAADPRSDVSLLVYATITIPAVAGAVILAARRTSRRWLRVVPAVVGTGALSAVIWHLMLSERRVQASYAGASTPYIPAVPWWAGAVAAAVLAVALAWRRRRGASLGAGLAVVLALQAAAAVEIAILAEHVVATTPHVAYLLRGSSPEPALGWWAAWALGAWFVLTLVASVPLARRQGPGGRALPAAFRGGAAVLAALCFVYTSYQPKSPHLERAIVSVDRADGHVRWIGPGLRGERGLMNAENSPATPTAVTDGARIYAYFGAPGALCVDSAGRMVWTCTDLPFLSREGAASSPVLCGDRVIVLSESDAGRYLAALDSRTGRLAWRIERTQAAHSFAGNCRTPTVRVVGGRPVLLVWGMADLTGYDAQTGRELWSHHIGAVGYDDNPVASLASDGRRLYLAGQARTVCVDAARLGSRDSPVVWQRELRRETEAGPLYEGAQCASPLVTDGLLFEVSDDGVAHCLEAATGRVLWRRALGQRHYASPVSAGRAVYFASTVGVTTAVQCAPTYRKLGGGKFGEPIYASLAPVDGRIYARTAGHVWCLAQK